MAARPPFGGDLVCFGALGHPQTGAPSHIQDKLKQRDEERERNITKRIEQYEEKYDFINKALLESIIHITEMTKTDHPTAAVKVKSADKMVMLPLLFDGSKPEVAKQHYMKDLISTSSFKLRVAILRIQL